MEIVSLSCTDALNIKLYKVALYALYSIIRVVHLLCLHREIMR